MIVSPYISDEDIKKFSENDFHEVDALVSFVAPFLKKISIIVRRNGVKNFTIYIKENDKKRINFVMVEDDEL